MAKTSRRRALGLVGITIGSTGVACSSFSGGEGAGTPDSAPIAIAGGGGEALGR